MRWARAGQSITVFNGGLNTVISPLAAKAGQMLLCQNYEMAPTIGYKRIDGYERFDGRLKPSDALFTRIDYSSGIPISYGDTVTGASSGASGICLQAITEENGYLLLLVDSGTFVAEENLQVGGITKAVSETIYSAGEGAEDESSYRAWQALAAAVARERIEAVPGYGPVLGVWRFGGKVYAFRNNLAETAAVMHKETSSGWVECDLGKSIAFTSGGTYEILEEDTVTGATSGATATVKRVIKTDGDWSTGDAEGRLILYNQTGTFQAENLDVGATGDVATIAGNSTANTLQPSGVLEFRNYNFYGHSGSLRMYGCDGVSNGFEWDGSVFVPIITGMAQDTPRRLHVHKNHLFFFFPGGSIQHSGVGEPISWTPITGASEMGLGDEVIGAVSAPGGVMMVFGATSNALLYGSSSADWQLKTFNDQDGAIGGSIQAGNVPIFVNGQGINIGISSDSFGDFKAQPVSKPIQNLIEKYRGLIIGSVMVRSKNQYRLFFGNGDVLVMSFDGERIKGFTMSYYPTRISAIQTITRAGTASAPESDLDNLFYGAEDGFVYQMDSGPSFDGQDVEAFFQIPANHMGKPRINKQFHRVTLEVEVEAGGVTTIKYQPDFRLFQPTNPEAIQREVTTDRSGGYWDISNWDEFYWNTGEVDNQFYDLDLCGIGAAIGGMFFTASAVDSPHTIKSMVIRYSERGELR